MQAAIKTSVKNSIVSPWGKIRDIIIKSIKQGRINLEILSKTFKIFRPVATFYDRNLIDRIVILYDGDVEILFAYGSGVIKF